MNVLIKFLNEYSVPLFVFIIMILIYWRIDRMIKKRCKRKHG